MLRKLYLYNFPSGSCPGLALGSESRWPFILKTCQRTLVLSSFPLSRESSSLFSQHDFLQAEQAYAYVLEIICGLKSKLIGENEIVSQFKNAYKDYCRQEKRQKTLLVILQKLLQDAKDIRSKYLLGIAQKTYSSLTRKILLSQHKCPHLLILGSGQLAEDMINQVKKKIPVTVSARNKQMTAELVDKHQVQIHDWSDIRDNHYHVLNQHSFVVNTIGTQEEILTPTFFKKWHRHQRRCFIDLSSPSPYRWAPIEDEYFYQLDDIFKLGAVREQKKLTQIAKAKNYLNQVVDKRTTLLQMKWQSMQRHSSYEL